MLDTTPAVFPDTKWDFNVEMEYDEKFISTPEFERQLEVEFEKWYKPVPAPPRDYMKELLTIDFGTTMESN